MKMKNWFMIIGITILGILAYFGFKKKKVTSVKSKNATSKGKTSQKTPFSRSPKK